MAVRQVLALAALWLTALQVRAEVPEPLREMVQRGDDRAALAALEPLETTPATRYLRARLLERLGDLAAAAAVYVGELPPLVQESGSRRRAHLLAKLGRCEEALALLQGRDRLSRAHRAECLAHTARTEEEISAARAALSAVLSSPPRDFDLYPLRILLAGITPDNADAIRREALLQHPTHRDADLSTVEWTNEERVRLAEAFVAARRPEAALPLLSGTPPTALRARWLHTYGMALYATRQHYALAARVLRHAWREGGDTAIDDRFHAARALSRADRDREAIAAYDALVAASPRHARAPQAAYLAGWLELRIAPSRGRRRMERFLRSRLARGDNRREASWQLGLDAYGRGDFARATRLFTTYRDAADEAPLQARGAYWIGRAEHRAGRPRAARLAYEQVSTFEPLGWYDLLACQRLGSLGATCTVLAAPEPARDPLSVTLPPEVRFFSALGLREDAYAALRGHERQIRRAAPRGRANEALVGAYMAAGAASRAYRLASYEQARLSQRPEGDARWAWDAAYPKPHFDTVRREAERLSVPWEQVYATMRQESGFDQFAVSHARAIGLLQVMPETAAASAGRPAFDERQLFDATTNIHFGVEEIAVVNRRFGSGPLAVAAYNAGVARVERWLREQGPIDLDLFVERIPFDETRGYVRRVIGHMARYRFAESGAIFSLPDRVEPPSGH